MATGRVNQAVDLLRRTVALREAAGLSDGQLLGRFVERRDGAAFEALVRRHGPMVWGVCRRLLGNPQDVEDAFQAAFLVLVRKAAAVVPREAVGNWLYGVAYHTAVRARAMNVRRRARECQVERLPEPEAPRAGAWEELQPVLDRELSRLPDKYRLPVVLCDLEGKPYKEAARQLGCPEGTLSGRLTRARRMLARRLARHGLTLSGAALAAVLAENAAAGRVPAPLITSAVKAAGQAAATSAKAAALTEGVLKTMLLNKLRRTTAGLLLAGLLATGAGLVLSGSLARGVGTAKGKEGAKRPAASATAVDLGVTYSTNDALADEKFTGKPARVTGQVERVRRVAAASGGQGSYFLVLEPGMGMEPKPTPIYLEFSLKARKKLAKLEMFQEVTVEGWCEGRGRVEGREAVVLRDCTLLEAKPLPKLPPPGVGGPPMRPGVRPGPGIPAGGGDEVTGIPVPAGP